MNPEIKTEWLEALRSGDYEQGDKVLRTKSNTYCCLGVLCDLAVKKGIAKWDASESLKSFAVTKLDPDDNLDVGVTLLPQFIVEWAGLTKDNPIVSVEVEGEENTHSLAELNDYQHFNFRQIADIIEEKL